MGKLVVLNPGHYLPNDPGACANGLKEAEVCEKIVARMVAWAPSHGFETVVVREWPLADITAKANAYKQAALFYSIHCNAGGGTGYEDYCVSGSVAANQLRAVIRKPVVSYMTANGFRDRGAKAANYYVIKYTNAPAILTENLFVDTAADANALKDDKFLDGLALAHVKGIAEALCTLGQPIDKEDDDMIRYEKSTDVPEWGRVTINKLISNGVLAGDGTGKIDISEDMLRILVINDRMGLYGKE